MSLEGCRHSGVCSSNEVWKYCSKVAPMRWAAVLVGTAVVVLPGCAGPGNREPAQSPRGEAPSGSQQPDRSESAPTQPPSLPAPDTRAFIARARSWRSVHAAEASARQGGYGPDATQEMYDIARDVEEKIARLSRVSDTCMPARRKVLAYVVAARTEAEAVDQLLPDRRAASARRAARVARALPRALAECRTGPTTVAREPARELIEPRTGEVSFGEVLDRGPIDASSATIRAGGRVVGRVPVVDGWVRARPAMGPGRYEISVDYHGARGKVDHHVSAGVEVLPARSRTRRPAAATADARISRDLGVAAKTFPGVSALLYADLSTGRSAGYNTDAVFPAASTVKLGVLLGAIQRIGRSPTRSPYLHDLEAIGSWSSNLATNRLMRFIGNGNDAEGAQVAQAALHRLGAVDSTFTGGYIVGTSYDPSRARRDIAREPPRVSRRVTTARDLAAALSNIHFAAAGDRRVLRQLGITKHQALVLLAVLVGSQPVADNRGLLRPTLGYDTPMAQKHGWISDARNSAAIVYLPDGPRLVVVLSYLDGMTRAQGERLGERALRSVGLAR